MLKRLSIFARAGTGTAADPYRANVPAGQSYVVVAQLTPTRWLVKQTLKDGTTTTAGWLVDVTLDANGRQVDVATTALTSGQLSTIKTWLTNQGIACADLSYTNVKDRKALLIYLLRKLAHWAGLSLADLRRLLLEGYDVAGQ